MSADLRLATEIMVQAFMTLRVILSLQRTVRAFLKFPTGLK